MKVMKRSNGSQMLRYEWLDFHVGIKKELIDSVAE
jgi:hypothetical protein